MFERSKVDNSQEQAAVPVELELEGQRVEKGRIWIARSKALAEVLNGPAQFLDFETYDGARRLVSKTALRSVSLTEVPQAGGLERRLKDDSFDPHAILGTDRGAAWEEVRSAFLARSKVYHPDRYANAELPGEVCDYLAAMARRINAAYAALEGEQRVVVARTQRAEPVYTSGRSR